MRAALAHTLPGPGSCGIEQRKEDAGWTGAAGLELDDWPLRFLALNSSQSAPAWHRSVGAGKREAGGKRETTCPCLLAYDHPRSPQTRLVDMHVPWEQFARALGRGVRQGAPRRADCRSSKVRGTGGQPTTTVASSALEQVCLHTTLYAHPSPCFLLRSGLGSLQGNLFKGRAGGSGPAADGRHGAEVGETFVCRRARGDSHPSQ